MPSIKDFILLFASCYGFAIGIHNFHKYHIVYSYTKLIIEVISSVLLAYHYTALFLALVSFNILYDITAFNLEQHFWKKLDNIKKRRLSSYYY